MGRTRWVAGAAGVASILILVGGAAFAIARDGDPLPTTTTTSTTTTTAPPTRAELAVAIARALARDLDVPLTSEQAACVADAFLEIVGEGPALALAETAMPLGAVSVDQRAQIVRGIVACVPPEIAAALLSSGPTVVTLAPGLPDDEG